MASAINLQLTEDDTEAPTFAITDEDGPLDLASAEVFAVIKATPQVEDSTATGVYTLTEGSGVTIVDAAAGTVQLSIPSAVTASPGTWFYKIRVTVGSATRTAITGRITVADA